MCAHMLQNNLCKTNFFPRRSRLTMREKKVNISTTANGTKVDLCMCFCVSMCVVKKQNFLSFTILFSCSGVSSACFLREHTQTKQQFTVNELMHFFLLSKSWADSYKYGSVCDSFYFIHMCMEWMYNQVGLIPFSILVQLIIASSNAYVYNEHTHMRMPFTSYIYICGVWIPCSWNLFVRYQSMCVCVCTLWPSYRNSAATTGSTWVLFSISTYMRQPLTYIY